MTLVDTSVWIDHFRNGSPRLRELLEEGEVATHPMVLGELACGKLPRRVHTLRLLARLPRIPQAPDHLVLQSIESRRLFGEGIGWIDAHLLTAALLCRLTCGRSTGGSRRSSEPIGGRPADIAAFRAASPYWLSRLRSGGAPVLRAGRIVDSRRGGRR